MFVSGTSCTIYIMFQVVWMVNGVCTWCFLALWFISSHGSHISSLPMIVAMFHWIGLNLSKIITILLIWSMSRNWNILNWNVRGINSQIRWDDLEQKLKKATVALFACKKLREIILTKLTSKKFHLEDTTNLHIMPLLAYQEGLLLYGMAVSL